MTKHYKIDAFWEFTFNTQKFDTGVATDADALPTYRVYEENNDTVLDSGNCAKRDDANTTGYYYVRGHCTVALGYEVGKTYEVRVAATVNSVAGAGVVGRFAMLPALVWDSLYGGTDNLQVDTIQIGGTVQTAIDVGASLANDYALETTAQAILAATPTTAAIATALWTDLLASTDFSTASSIGKLLKDYIDAAISSRGTSTYTGGAVASVTAPVTAGTVSDKTGYALAATGLDAITATEPTAKPTTFAAWLMWLVQRHRRASKTPTALLVKTEAGATVTTQVLTDDGAGTETLGAPS